MPVAAEAAPTGGAHLCQCFSATETKSPASAGLFVTPEPPDYFAFNNATVMSSMRFEKPHSLSYQDSTLTSVPPMTRVCVLS